MLIDTRTKSRAYGRHSAFAPFFASTWLHSLRYAEVSFRAFVSHLKAPSSAVQRSQPALQHTFGIFNEALIDSLQLREFPGRSSALQQRA